MARDGFASSYEVVVEGGASERVVAELGRRGLEIAVRGEHLVLRGDFADLAQLNALLFALDDLGLALVSVRQLP
ncbi:hypothetical protein KV102_12730 [Mumia sp. zg.B53]|uniref:hypothetical protein n=1 Tax=unclassified Mumia TaxID=2621872 RepID=UPI001C6E336C|nr:MULTISPECIES: hypothetical protein [unclassified Mumia]MBW9211138.1 hypothetical protein [Mumia sp. zg.B21]MBW9215707.1 hypothetical protein [Mumia sp. zg.B53]